jgi:hypothetical protein
MIHMAGNFLKRETLTLNVYRSPKLPVGEGERKLTSPSHDPLEVSPSFQLNILPRQRWRRSGEGALPVVALEMVRGRVIRLKRIYNF